MAAIMKHAKLDLTLLVYQPVENWLSHVKGKYGEAFAARCQELIPEGITLMSQRKGLNASILAQVISELVWTY